MMFGLGEGQGELWVKLSLICAESARAFNNFLKERNDYALADNFSGEDF